MALQPSATSPHFGQTFLFTNFPSISTTVRGSKFQGIREKAGLFKMGLVADGCGIAMRIMRCVDFLGCYDLL
jgi:hypothetical protein